MSSREPDARVAQLVAIDVFGVAPRTTEHLLAQHGDGLRRLGEGMMHGAADADPSALLERIRREGDFAYVEPSLVGYFEDDGMKYFLTLDVVERADAARRMAFLDEPTGELPDPDGLISAWQAYEASVLELMSSGDISPARSECPAFHCLGDHRHAVLAGHVRPIVERVPERIEELTDILRADRHETDRAAAAYLLAYAGDGRDLVHRLLPSIRDPSAFVRNSVMRVLADIAFYHPEIDIPLSPVLRAFEFPSTSDRNKAAAIVAGILKRPGAAFLHDQVINDAGGPLIAMLRLRQPNNHDFAYDILKIVSGQDFGEHAHDAWASWLHSRPR